MECGIVSLRMPDVEFQCTSCSILLTCFANGCFNWRILNVNVGSINWALGSNACADNDYTNVTTSLNAGSSYPMAVTSGVWCGCSVWIDFDQNEIFDAGENMFHNYTGDDPSYTYSFNLDIPSNVATGSYRMRVIGAWGSDGFTVGGVNGFGPCGSFQYGNFNDFTVNVIGTPVGIPDLSEKTMNNLVVSPNPASSYVTILLNAYKGGEATLQLTDMAGKIMRTIQVTKDKEELDFGSYSKGIYFLRYIDGVHNQNIRIVK